MLASIGTGIWFGASLDTYQRFLGKRRRFRWTQIVNDILFFIIQSLVFFYVLFLVNFGEVRFYLLLALVLGYAAYRALFEGLYLRILERVITITKQIFHISQRIIMTLIVNPVKWLLKVLLTLGMIVLGAFYKIINVAFRFITFPFRWLTKKYVQAYGIPFHSYFKRMQLLISKLNKLLKSWFKKSH